MQKILFIDRDGVLITEPVDDPQIDAFSKLQFTNGVFSGLREIATKLDYRLVMVTNQDGLGTDSFPENDFWPVHNFIIDGLKKEDIHFEEVHIDRSFEYQNSPNRKPRTGMLTKYLEGDYDLENSFVIGDRLSDMHLAKNLGTKGIRINGRQLSAEDSSLVDTIVLEVSNWHQIKDYLFKLDRKAKAIRSTSETKIEGAINLDGSGIAEIETGLGFFDHMLDQIARHSSSDLFIKTQGDLYIDEHHTVEDTAIVLGQLFKNGLGKKAGITRYGFSLPMDEAKAQVLLDFGGRPWIEWDVNFKREKIGDVPTEMFFHFFKSFSDHALCNLNISAKGDNEHHVIEAVFKAFAKAIKMAKSRIEGENAIPSTKGII